MLRFNALLDEAAEPNVAVAGGLGDSLFLLVLPPKIEREGRSEAVRGRAPLEPPPNKAAAPPLDSRRDPGGGDWCDSTEPVAESTLPRPRS